MYRLLTQQASVWLFQRKRKIIFKPVIHLCFLTKSVSLLTLYRCPLYLWSAFCVCWRGCWCYLEWTWSEYRVAAASSVVTCPCLPYYSRSRRWRSWNHPRWSGRIHRTAEVGSPAHHLRRYLQHKTLELCKLSTIERFLVSFYRYFQAISAEVPSHQMKAICLSSGYQWSE